MNKLTYRNVEFLTGLAGYENGEEIGTITGHPLDLADERISNNLIMGRKFVDEDGNYASSQIRELIIWEKVLNEAQINDVFDFY